MPWRVGFGGQATPELFSRVCLGVYVPNARLAPTAGFSTWPFATRSALQMRARCAPSGHAEIPMTTPSPRPSSVSTRPRSSGSRDLGEQSTSSSWQLLAGSSGGTTDVSTPLLTTSHRQSSRRPTMRMLTPATWRETNQPSLQETQGGSAGVDRAPIAHQARSRAQPARRMHLHRRRQQPRSNQLETCVCRRSPSLGKTRRQP